MKKFILFPLICLTAGTLFAAGTYPLLQINTAAIGEKLQEAAQQSQQKASLESTSTGASEDGVVRIELQVEVDVDTENFFENELNPMDHYPIRKCAAVRIAPNYLLASLSCRGTSSTETLWQPMGSSEPEKITGVPVLSHKTTSVQVEKEKLTDIKEDPSSKLMLIKLNEKAAEKLKNRPIANLFVPQDMQSIEKVFDKLVVNREHYILPKRTCATNEFASMCNERQCFRVCWKLIDADNGDPIFGLQKALHNQEFLIGFNDAEPDGTDRGQSRVYRVLSAKSLEFLKRNMDADSWKKLERKTVDETILK